MSPTESSSAAGLAGLVSSSPLTRIAEIAADHGSEVYLVGGALRDALLERPVADLDIAVTADFGGFVEAFSGACGRRPVPIGDRWRDTHRIHWKGLQIDVARLLGPLDEDLAQRDFTVNAMALPLSATSATCVIDALVDLHGGRADLKAGLIRMLSEQVLDEDPLRLLRAVRYRAVLDGFEIDEKTRRAIVQRADSIGGLAAERVQTEWASLLSGSAWLQGVEIAYELGLGALTLTAEVSFDALRAWSEREPASQVDDDAVAGRLAALLTQAVATDPVGATDRLIERRWPASLARRASRAARWAGQLESAPTEVVVGWVLEDSAAAMIAAPLAEAIATARGGTAAEASGRVRLYVRRAAEPHWVRGADLIDWGMEPGPELGALLDQLARGQLERRWDSAADARDWAHEQAVLDTARESA